MVFNLYSRFNSKYFPWLLDPDNEWQHERCFDTYEEALHYAEQQGTAALEYSIRSEE